jgi:hypothetical protein
MLLCEEMCRRLFRDNGGMAFESDTQRERDFQLLLFYWMKWRGRNEWMKRKKAQQKVTN